jgi:aspartate kinase
MQVFKFGGASLKDAAGVRNVGAIIQRYANNPLLVVVSAMGKTTDQLEQVVSYHHAGKDYQSILNNLRSYHLQIINDLFQDTADITKRLDKIMEQIEQEVSAPGEYDMVYDQVICFGEILSSLIVQQYLSQQIPTAWIDARKYIATDNTFREGKVDWIKTASDNYTRIYR